MNVIKALYVVVVAAGVISVFYFIYWVVGDRFENPYPMLLLPIGGLLIFFGLRSLSMQK